MGSTVKPKLQRKVFVGLESEKLGGSEQDRRQSGDKKSRSQEPIRLQKKKNPSFVSPEFQIEKEKPCKTGSIFKEQWKKGLQT